MVRQSRWVLLGIVGVRLCAERSGMAVKVAYVTDCQGKSLRGMAVEASSGATRYALLRWCAVWQLW